MEEHYFSTFIFFSSILTDKALWPVRIEN